MDTQHLAEFFADQHLHGSALAGVIHQEASGHGHGLDHLAVGDALCLQFLFRGAHLGHLGMGEDDGGDGLVGHAVGHAEHIVHGHHSLTGGGVGQQAAAGHVAAGPDSGHAGLAELVGDHSLPVHVHIQRLQSQFLGDGAASRGIEHIVSSDLLLLALGVQVEEGGALDFHHLAVEVDGDAGPGEFLVELLADFVIHHGGDLGHHLHDGDLGARRVEEIGELQSDDAAADDHQGLGQLVQGQDARGVQHQGIVPQAGDGGGGGDGAGGQEDVGPLVDLAGGLHLTGGQDFGLGFHHFHAGALFQGGDAPHQLGDHLLLAGLDGGHVQHGLPLGLHAVGGGLLALLQALDGAHEGLGGDAAHIQAGAPQFLLFKEDHLFLEMPGGVGRGLISAGTGADDHQIIHGKNLLGLWGKGWGGGEGLASSSLSTEGASLPGDADQLEVLDVGAEGLEEAGAGSAVHHHVVHGQGELHIVAVGDGAVGLADGA